MKTKGRITGRLTSPKQLETLRKSIEAKKDPKKPCIALCVGTGCLAYGCRGHPAGLRGRDGQAEAGEQRRRQGHRLPRASARGARCSPSTPRASSTSASRSRMCPRSSPRPSSKGRVVSRLLYTDPNTKEQLREGSRRSFLQAAAAAPPRRQQQDRPHLDGGLPGHRRLLRAGQGPLPDEAGAGHRRGQEVGPAGPRRRRLPHRQQVAVHPRGRGRYQVRDLQLRRGRPRRVHGPQPDGGQPPQRAGRHDHRRLRHRLARGLRLYPA